MISNLPYCSLCYEQVKVILWWIRTFWYKGLAKIWKKTEFEKRQLSHENNSPGSKADFRKSFYLAFGGYY